MHKTLLTLLLSAALTGFSFAAVAPTSGARSSGAVSPTSGARSSGAVAPTSGARSSGAAPSAGIVTGSMAIGNALNGAK